LTDDVPEGTGAGPFADSSKPPSEVNVPPSKAATTIRRPPLEIPTAEDYSLSS